MPGSLERLFCFREDIQNIIIKTRVKELTVKDYCCLLRMFTIDTNELVLAGGTRKFRCFWMASEACLKPAAPASFPLGLPIK
jgi:hypothetical protein